MRIRITEVRAQREIVDRLVWTTEVTFSGAQEQVFRLAGWFGEIALSRQSRETAAPPGRPWFPQLIARWNAHEAGRLRYYGSQSTRLQFLTELPGDALERIEQYWSDGILHARISGTFFTVCVKDIPLYAMDQLQTDSKKLLALAPESPIGMAAVPEYFADSLCQTLALRRRLAAPNHSIRDQVSSEPFEISRERWNGHLRPVLRPPSPTEESATSTVTPVASRSPGSTADAPATADDERLPIAIPDRLTGAYYAFEHGRFEFCIAECGRAAKALYQELSQSSGSLRDDDLRTAVLKQATNLQKLTAQPPTSQQAAFARHILVAMATLFELDSAIRSDTFAG